ncbi:MAG TPA: glycosyltransferase family 39 protein [Caulobacteraceae bacterium]|nr:glycosyltransferase family 39 protein [Caulobacteraceae bacterium]
MSEDEIATTARPPARTRAGELATGAAAVLAALAIAASSLLRLVIAGRQPLWLDETWTGAIAAQTSLGAFWRQVYLDVNAPFYYLVMHLWQGLFGLSDVSLRLPSALFGAAAPLAIAFAETPGLERAARLTWAALLALWIPGLWLSGDARCYTLLILLCTLQTLAFARLLGRPDLRGAVLWCGVSALAVLTHYHAVIPTALEGLAYLALARGKAVRTWPAALLFLPAAAWMAFHAPRIAAFADPAIAWYRLLRIDRLGRVAAYPIGTPDLALTLLAIGAVALVLGYALRNRRPAPPRRPTLPLWIAFGLALLGAAIVVGLGFLRPSFTDRYLVPFVPALLLGVALATQALSRRLALTYAVVVAAAAGFVVPWAWTEMRSGWRYYNWEQASQDLMRGRPERLVFVWDHPASRILEPDQLEAVGGFFFRRAGQPVAVRSVTLAADVDPNPILAAAAKGPRTAIIWAYDRGVLGAAARRFVPRLSELDPTLVCRNYARGSVGVLACDHLGSVKTTRP